MIVNNPPRSSGKAVFIGPGPSIGPTEKEFFQELEMIGEAGVRADIDSGTQIRVRDKLKWLHEKDLARQEATVRAAEDAARAAKRSAMWAAAGTLIAVLALLVALFRPDLLPGDVVRLLGLAKHS